MEAIILAGGMGTRLQNIISDVPKPMAPVNGRPLLQYILSQMSNYNFGHIVLAVGYKSEVIVKYFGNKYKNIKLSYSTEEYPLGTGGAIKKAFRLINGNEAFVLNGDSYNEIDFDEYQQFHIRAGSRFTIAVKHMENISRFGVVAVKENVCTDFEEKLSVKSGLVNCGVYLVEKSILEKVKVERFSFEKDILEKHAGIIVAFRSGGYFLDIGIPEDYIRAQSDFKKIKLV